MKFPPILLAHGTGEGFVGLKEADFEPSSPMRHATELCSILDMQLDDKKILQVYTDGGPDHRVTYVSVKVALIAVFLKCLSMCCMYCSLPFLEKSGG